MKKKDVAELMDLTRRQAGSHSHAYLRKGMGHDDKASDEDSGDAGAPAENDEGSGSEADQEASEQPKRRKIDLGAALPEVFSAQQKGVAQFEKEVAEAVAKCVKSLEEDDKNEDSDDKEGDGANKPGNRCGEFEGVSSG